VKTKTCPFEFTATPGTSPKCKPGGSFRKSGTDSKGISGTVCCANAGDAKSAATSVNMSFTTTSHLH
jgi:hypothetical protein